MNTLRVNQIAPASNDKALSQLSQASDNNKLALRKSGPSPLVAYGLSILLAFGSGVGLAATDLTEAPAAATASILSEVI